MEEKNTADSTEKTSEQINVTEPETANEKKETPEDDLITLINNLIDFEDYIKSLKSMDDIFTKENFDFLNKLSLKENIKINLILSKIYMNIISNDSLYNEYLTSIKEESTDKVDLLFLLIENCISLIEKLNTFVFSAELYEFKKKIIDLLKCIYYNCKAKIKDEQRIYKILNLIETLPPKFFSESFIELNKSKELYEICKTKETDKISDFEEKFSEINNYYEQLDAFKKFVESNSGIATCTAVDEESIIKKAEILDFKPNNDKIDFYGQYGTLLLKFCKYHNYMFLDKEEEEKEKEKEEKEMKGKTEEEKKEDEDEENNDNVRMVFLLDKIDQEKYEDEEDKNKKIENILKNKQFTSSYETKEYNDLIKREINYYLNVTKNIEKETKIKIVREHLNYYLSTLNVESYYPLYLKDFTKITISDNFTPSYITNVPAGQISRFYFETEPEQETLAYIEFSLEDKSKDITFELNKYEMNGNKFINIFKEEKISNTFKFFIFCHGYSLYEMVFDNYYSWFNSKDINYRISLLKLTETSKKEEENQFNFKINGKTYTFNGNELNIESKENKDEKILNIPVVFYLNNLKIGTLKKKENENENENEKENENESIKNGYDLEFKEHKEEDEVIMPRHTFNYLLINHLKKIKFEKDKKYKIVISIFSENRDLISTCEGLKDYIDKEENNEKKFFLRNIGFCPEDKIDKFKVEYKLYDPEEQLLTYHVFFNISKEIKISKSILLVEFVKTNVNIAIYYKSEIIKKLKGKEINFKDFNFDKIDEILDLIKNVSDNYEGIELVLSIDNNLDEENKKKLSESIEKVKTFCHEKVYPPMKIYEYEQNDVLPNVIKYTNSIYEI